ncbi:MAG: hypothetical protein ACOYKJ_00500 [Candidatus Howiella sp.]|jgi:hypothetical protein
MASTNKTTNGLNQWVLSDTPKMEDFNADNQILDAAITKANAPLTGIGEGGITGEYLAEGIRAFGRFCIVLENSNFDTPLVPDTAGAPLYVRAGDHISLANWSQGDDYQQLYIGVKEILPYYGVEAGLDLIRAEGIYKVVNTALSCNPESDFISALLIHHVPGNSEYTYGQIWIGTGIYKRYKLQSTGKWTAWTEVSGNLQKRQSGDSSARPDAPQAGECYFDETLGKPVWWQAAGEQWVDAAGTAV